MRGADIDWRYLGKDTLLPLVTTAAAITVLVLSAWYVSTQESDYARISVDQNAMNADYDALIFRKRLVDRYHRRYERFRNHGFIGEESRLDWIETLRLTAAELALSRVATNRKQ